MSKGFTIQTRFMAILTEHKKNLLLKNFTERGINSRADEGNSLKELQASFQSAINENLWVYRLVSFPLEMTGHFDLIENQWRFNSSHAYDRQTTGHVQRTTDDVRFLFTFSYDPYNLRLNLLSLHATLNEDFEKTYLITRHPSLDLPPAGKAHRDLDALRTAWLLEKAKEINADKKKANRPKR